MSTLTPASTARPRWLPILGGLVAIAALLLLVALWGGSIIVGPRLYTGLALLLGLFLAFALGFVWLFLSPLAEPPAAVAERPRAAEVRQLVAVLAMLSGLMLSIGGLWDQAWHVIYGDFGNDFLWPPHMLIYASLGMIALFAGAALLLLLARGRGGLRARLRREPLIAFLGLTSAYMVAAIPSDLIWHQIYGIDITAWSLPHVLIGVNFLMVMFATLALQVEQMPARVWQSWRSWRGGELLALVPLLWGTTILLQIFTAEWDNIRQIVVQPATAYERAFWSRPEWLYPVIVAAIALFIGNVALHTLRRPGAATLLALLTIGYRLSSLAILTAAVPNLHLMITPPLLLLPPMVALDLWYAARLPRAEQPSTLLGGNLLALAAYLVLGLPLIAATMVYPRVNGATLPGMLLFSLLVGLVTGWAGARFSGWLVALGQRTMAAPQPRAWVQRAALGALGLAIIAVALFMVTARPPA